MWLYVPFTGAQGILKLTLRVLDGQTVLFEAGGQLTCGDPDSTYELTTPVSGLTFARPGVYVIEVLADGVAFARRELRVIAKAPVPSASFVLPLSSQQRPVIGVSRTSSGQKQGRQEISCRPGPAAAEDDWGRVPVAGRSGTALSL